MREKKYHFPLPFQAYHIEHQDVNVFQEISRFFNKNKDIEYKFHDILTKDVDAQLGRKGMSARQIIRACIVKFYYGLSYDQLYLRIADSLFLPDFCGFDDDWIPKKSTLQTNISRIPEKLMKQLNKMIIRTAKAEQIECGRRVRIDTTAVSANIHRPSDTWLMEDSVKLLYRLICKLYNQHPALNLKVHNHYRAAKKHAWILRQNIRENQRNKSLKALFKVTENTIGYATQAVSRTRKFAADNPSLAMLQASANELEQVVAMAQQVVDVARRRLIYEEDVPAAERVWSLFEPHSYIIVKGSRNPVFGHKITVATGETGMIFHWDVHEGNPYDSTLFESSIIGVTEVLGRVPMNIAADSGYTSRKNLKLAREFGIKNVALGPKGSVDVKAGTGSHSLFKKLMRFRAGVEGIISTLKRCMGLDRVNWHGFKGFKRYVGGAVITFNLKLLALGRLAKVA